ncbi:hypothetical protein B0H15DRAFT_817511 [Mycena belliarum]|uniref:Uncharacterized protein n=1 Tax=Mycena belliarum TaxID=1033014 RepID=A0AAD6UFK0_9AGAR|nr:hypothetical protein B0H15DRAFT_817511 [Mycena belliae]
MRPAAAIARAPCRARSAAWESMRQCARVAPRRRHPCLPHAVLSRPLAAVPDAGERAATPNAADSGGASSTSHTSRGWLRWRLARAALPLVQQDRLGYGRAGGCSDIQWVADRDSPPQAAHAQYAVNAQLSLRVLHAARETQVAQEGGMGKAVVITAIWVVGRSTLMRHQWEHS